MRKTSSIVLILVLVIMTVIAIGYWYQDKNSVNDIVLHGNVDIRQVDLAFRVNGRLSAIYVDEGDLVHQGDLLAQLDKVPFSHEFDLQKAQLEQFTANSEKLKSGNRPQEIQQADSLVKQREAIFANTKKIFERQEELFKKKLASKQTYDDSFAQMTEAQAQLRAAKEAYTLSLAGFRTEDIAIANAQLNEAKARLANATTNLQDTDLYAPSNGVILTRIKEPGSILTAGNAVLTLSLFNPVWIRAYISEIDLGKIKPGMQALVYTDTEPQNPFTGKIGFISPTAEFTPKNIETKELRTDLVYRLRIIVDDPAGKLRQGMPVVVKINTVLPLALEVKNPHDTKLKIMHE